MFERGPSGRKTLVNHLQFKPPSTHCFASVPLRQKRGNMDKNGLEAMLRECLPFVNLDTAFCLRRCMSPPQLPPAVCIDISPPCQLLALPCLSLFSMPRISLDPLSVLFLLLPDSSSFKLIRCHSRCCRGQRGSLLSHFG